MKSKGVIFEVNKLSEGQKNRMFELLCAYFEGVDRDTFNKDLQEKTWVIILQDRTSNKIKGFSTQMLMEATIAQVPIKAIFSGDTIIDKDYWGDQELIRTWGEFAFMLLEKYADIKIYWFLISMGYRTYRFMPLFFKEFYPRYDKSTPENIKRIMDALAFKKYPSLYDSKNGIIHPEKRAYLKSGISDINNGLLKDPHISFFVKINPKHMQGDELVCLTEVSKSNFKPIAYRILAKSNTKI